MGAICHHSVTLVCWKRLPHSELVEVSDTVGVRLKADEVRVGICLNEGNHLIVLDSDTGIVPATVREIALSLDLAQLQAIRIKEESVTCLGLIGRLSAQYDNCLIVQSRDKRPCARCKVGVDVVRVDFLPHLRFLVSIDN